MWFQFLLLLTKSKNRKRRNRKLCLVVACLSVQEKTVPHLCLICQLFCLLISHLFFFPIISSCQASGKLIVLDQLLKKLHDTGHRVLLFAQMTHTLDILQVVHYPLFCNCHGNLHQILITYASIFFFGYSIIRGIGFLGVKEIFLRASGRIHSGRGALCCN